MSLLSRRSTPHFGSGGYSPALLGDRNGLTRLLSQAAFTAHVDIEMHRAAESGSPLALACFRLGVVGEADRSLGNLVAIRLLTEASRRLRICMGGSDLVGHFDDDEFAILLPGSDFEAGLAQSVLTKESLEQPFHFDPVHVSVTVVFGITSYPECDAVDARGFLAQTRAVVPPLPAL
jgi:diguanylate cyclase (GGDEF)-like protein